MVPVADSRDEMAAPIPRVPPVTTATRSPASGTVPARIALGVLLDRCAQLRGIEALGLRVEGELEVRPGRRTPPGS